MRDPPRFAMKDCPPGAVVTPRPGSPNGAARYRRCGGTVPDSAEALVRGAATPDSHGATAGAGGRGVRSVGAPRWRAGAGRALAGAHGGAAAPDRRTA